MSYYRLRRLIRQCVWVPMLSDYTCRNQCEEGLDVKPNSRYSDHNVRFSAGRMRIVQEESKMRELVQRSRSLSEEHLKSRLEEFEENAAVHAAELDKWLDQHQLRQKASLGERRLKRLVSSENVREHYGLMKDLDEEIAGPYREELAVDLIDHVGHRIRGEKPSAEVVELIGWWANQPVLEFSSDVEIRHRTYWLHPVGDWWRIRIEPSRDLDELCDKGRLVRVQGVFEKPTRREE